MKKIVAVLFALALAVSASVCSFAVSSPDGEVTEDKLTLIGKVTTSGNPYKDVEIKLDDSHKDTTDSKGDYRIENVELGEYTITLTKDGTINTLKVNLKNGTETKYNKLPDGSYEILVKADISVINIDFNLDGSKIVVTKVKAAGNDSPDAPNTGDVVAHTAVVLMIVSFAGMGTSLYFKKKRSM